jgi:hypothetical protein
MSGIRGGECVSLFGIVCVGSGPVTSEVKFHFHPTLSWAQTIDPISALIIAGNNQYNCLENGGSFGTCTNENFNPAFSLLMNTRTAWEGWSNPCVSSWTETHHIFNATLSAAATIGLASGIEDLGPADLSEGDVANANIVENTIRSLNRVANKRVWTVSSEEEVTALFQK